MKRYEVVVNNEVYEVSLRELAPDEKVAVTSLPQSTPSPSTSPSAPVAKEGYVIKAPMGGAILSIKAKEGQSVKAGDTLFILEAMKMENEIKAPQDGVVKTVLISEGQTVETNQELAII